MAIKFNRNQTGNPTPANVVFWVRVGSAICGGVSAWMMTAAWIPASLQNILSSILGGLIMIANIIVPFFGVEVKEDTVPTEQVTSIDK